LASLKSVGAELAPGGLIVAPGLHVSFQRYARPPGDVVARAPSSLGALPLGVALSGALVLPVAPDEAFWIGLEMTRAAASAEIGLRFESPSQPAVDALSGAPWNEERPAWMAVPPGTSIDGIALATGGFRCFTRTRNDAEDDATGMLGVVVRAEGGRRTTRIALLAYAGFESATGHPRPATLDRSSQYGGWRLP
jgi:hypothetical protein